jgi:hypothetical protein
LVRPLWRKYGGSSKTYKTIIWFSNSSSGTYPKAIAIGMLGDICILRFIAALFTIVKIWTPPMCISTDEWILKM